MSGEWRLGFLMLSAVVVDSFMIDVWDRAVCKRIGVVSCVFGLLVFLLLLEMATRYVLEGEDRSNVGWHFVPEVLSQVCSSFETSAFEVPVVT